MILYIRISPRNRETTQGKKIIKELGTIPYEYLHKLVNKKKHSVIFMNDGALRKVVPYHFPLPGS